MPTSALTLSTVALMLTALGLAAAEPAGGALNGGTKPRIIVSTDIGGDDPDDFQSMVHLFVYLDVLDVEGLVSSPPGAGRATHIQEAINAYEQDYAKLSSWASYPTPTTLRNMTKQGATTAQSGTTPPTSISTGAQHIIDRAKVNDARPLHVLVWGSITDVAQAVHKDPSIKNKLRVYAIGSWNTSQDPKAMAYLKDNHVKKQTDALWMIENNSTFRGMYLGGTQSGDLGNLSFPDQHVKGHGALGTLFMNKKKDIKMGDTPSLMYLFTGNPSDPTGESWGGQFQRDTSGAAYWKDRTDYVIDGRNGAGTVAKWRTNYLRDWQARMDRAKDAKPTGSNQAPSVALTAPSNGASFTAPAAITVSANASDSDGSIAKVEFFAGSTKIGEDSSAPFSITWSNVAAGSYNLTAMATDNQGATKTSTAVAITVSAAANQTPSVALTAPSAGASFTAPAAITVSANASDSDGSIAKVEFFAGSTKIGEDTSAPYGITWSNVSAGSYNLTAKATDNQGATKTSTAVAITVTAPPTSGDDLISGLATKFQKATLAVGSAVFTDRSFTVSSVGIYGGAQQIRTPNNDKGNSASSGYLTFTATAAAEVLVAYDSRASGLPAWLSGFTATGETLTTTDVSFRLYRRSYAAGSVIDLGGNLASGASGAGSNYWVIVRSSGDTAPANQAPSVALTHPSSGASSTAPASITVSASASDSDGSIAKVEFFAGSTKIGEDSTSPYSITWSNVAAGSYSLTAKATDNLGASTVSAAVAITVTAPSSNGEPIAINFQPASAPTVAGYLVDSGQTYASRNGQTYGWNQANGTTRDRNAVSDQRVDTLIHAQKTSGLVWELAVPNGSYEVTLACGDPSFTDQVNTVAIEGTVVNDPDGGDALDVYTVVVTVSDGRLTIAPAAGASNAKFHYVEVVPLTTGNG